MAVTDDVPDDVMPTPPVSPTQFSHSFTVSMSFFVCVTADIWKSLTPPSRIWNQYCLFVRLCVCDCTVIVFPFNPLTLLASNGFSFISFYFGSCGRLSWLNSQLSSTCASAVVIHYEEALYQVYGPLPLPSVCTFNIIGLSHHISG